MSVQFQVYVRYGCHLCDEMLQHLNVLASEYDFDLVAIDINGKDELEKQYGDKIPVLVYRQQEVCRYILDEQRFRQIMTQ